MATKHTPGPWYATEKTQVFMEPDDNSPIPATVIGSAPSADTPMLALVLCTSDEDEANTRLMASAPTLLGACRALVDAYARRAESDNPIDWPELDEAHRLTLEALQSLQ